MFNTTIQKQPMEVLYKLSVLHQEAKIRYETKRLIKFGEHQGIFLVVLLMAFSRSFLVEQITVLQGSRIFLQNTSKVLPRSLEMRKIELNFPKFSIRVYIIIDQTQNEIYKLHEKNLVQNTFKVPSSKIMLLLFFVSFFWLVFIR